MGLDELTVDPSKFSTSEAAIRDAAGTREIQQSLNELAFSVAETQFNQNLTRLDYDGGFFHVFEDNRSVVSKTDKLNFNGGISPFVFKYGDGTPTILNDQNDAIFGIDYAPDNRVAVAVAGEGTVYIYDDTYTKVREISLIADFVYIGAFGPSNRLAIGDVDNNVKVFDSNYGFVDTLSDASDSVFSIDWDPSDGRLASGDASGFVNVYDSSLNLVKTISDASGQIKGLSFNPNNGRLVAGSADNHIRVYDNNYNLLKDVTASDDITDVDFGPNGKLVATSFDENVRLYNSNLNLIDSKTPNGLTTEAARFRSDGGFLVLDSSPKLYHYSKNFSLLETASISEAEIMDVNRNTNEAALGGSNTSKVYQYRENPIIFTTFSDLNLDNDGFATSPADAVVSHDFTPDTDDSHTIEYTISDQSGNSVTISESKVGDIVDVSNLQDTTLSIQVDVTDDDFNASLNNFAIHFNE